MKYLAILLTCLFISFIPSISKANAQPDLAQEYFDSGRYWDAFMACKSSQNGGSDFTNLSLLENSKKAMVLQQKYHIYRDLKQYPEAIEKLQSLLLVNPKDPEKPDLGVMAYLHARRSQNMALNQHYRAEAENKFQEAVKYYQMAMQEGISSQEILPKLKLCEKQLNIVKPLNKPEIVVNKEVPASGYPDKQTVNGTPATTSPESRTRKVLILNNEEE